MIPNGIVIKKRVKVLPFFELKKFFTLIFLIIF